MGVVNLLVLACVLRPTTKKGRQLFRGRKVHHQRKSWLRLGYRHYHRDARRCCCGDQYMFEVSKDDEVLMELTQKMPKLLGIDRETIGFTIMQVLHLSFVHSL